MFDSLLHSLPSRGTVFVIHAKQLVDLSVNFALVLLCDLDADFLEKTCDMSKIAGQITHH
nr:MAG: hypothetical protein AM324_11425 [Candidatus Thorarchaeota archaeon SMTZ1-83]